MKPSRIQGLVEALGVELKARRAELGYSQEDLAAKAGLDRPYVSLVEVGLKQPTLSVLFRLARGVDLTFEELAGRVESRYGRSTLE
ncbi:MULTISPECIES: helix-turn-helix domain-containing protein [unclassified Roseateles]|uniref:helix-turn-helix domain-containing protein n=1 Tax=unclassified Roseateles TaxID=2626991 RepID=UPI0006FD63F6|nr:MULTISPECIES: helix-turn-helix transcriptional regulator [unclassified Roseateles]KQW43284.1 XRE family transcriptional regulator [Pelomonas sp. Root405]KRA71022.1 XRE family transcriptional regulator [Pelomonas sp. Root662]